MHCNCLHFEDVLQKFPYERRLYDSFLKLNNLCLQRNDLDNNMLLGYTSDGKRLDVGDTVFYDHNPDVPGSWLLFAKIIEKLGTDVVVKNLKGGAEVRLPPTRVFGYANPGTEIFQQK